MPLHEPYLYSIDSRIYWGSVSARPGICHIDVLLNFQLAEAGIIRISFSRGDGCRICIAALQTRHCPI